MAKKSQTSQPDVPTPERPTLVMLAKQAAIIVLNSEVSSGHMTPLLGKNLLAAMDKVYTALVEQNYGVENKETPEAP